MRNIVSFLVFCSIALACSTLLEANKCSYGPTFWCDSLQNAKSCNAVQHCIQTVWETTILPEDNDDICSICKEMVAEARDQLQSNETQEEIRQVFEGSCKLIPIRIIRDECIKLSDEFIPELIDTLSSQMNPQAVCATAGLCNSVRIDRLLRTYKQNEVLTKSSSPNLMDDCKDCTTFIQDVITNIENHPAQYLFNHLIAICDQLSSLSDGCRALVEINFQQIYNFLTQELKAKDVCDLFGMCARLFGSDVTSFARGKDETCDFCEAVIRSWRETLTSNTTKHEFKMILDGICHQTGSFEKECLSLVDQYFEVLYNVIVSEIQPKEICEAVGLCGEHSIFKTETPYWPLFEMRPENHMSLEGNLRQPLRSPGRFTGNDEANSYRSQVLPRVPLLKAVVEAVSIGKSGILEPASTSSPRVQGKNLCIMCEFILHFLQNMLNDKMTRDEIRQEMDKVCTYMPKSIVEECQDYVDAYSNDVIQYIILTIDPTTVCPAIHMCPSHFNVEEKPTCVLCEFVVTQLDQLLKNKTTEEEIKSAIDQVCSILPKSIENDCRTFVDLYIDQLVDLIVNDYTPREMCGELGLCPKKDDGILSPLPEAADAQLPVSRFFVPVEKDVVELNPESKQSSECVLCEFIMARIDSLILKNSTEEAIRNILKKVCSILPSSLMTDCLAFMEEYSDSIVQLLVNKLDPELVCREIGLCKSAFLSGLPKAVVQMPADKCDVCHRIMNFVELNNDKKDQSIYFSDYIVKNVCDPMLPLEEQQICKDISTTYGMYLTRLLDVLHDQTAVCQSIEQCLLDDPNENYLQ